MVKQHSNLLENKALKNSLQRDTYVDDWITAVDTPETALLFYSQTVEHMAKAHFHFKKWISNSSEVMNSLPPNMQATQGNVAFGQDDVKKTLGLHWNTSKDVFEFPVLLLPTPKKLTKRVISSHISKIFDPTGYVSLFTVLAKQILQKCWAQHCDWDTKVDENIASLYNDFITQLPDLSAIQIPRCIAQGIS